MTRRPLTPSQTIGPFFHGGLLRADAVRNMLVPPDSDGERIRVEGHVYDGDRVAVPDALIEIWQANRHGRYHHPAEEGRALLDRTFLGFGRSGTDSAGAYWFETIRPGRVAYDETRLQAPHISVAVFARGLLNHLFTRLYFADEFTNALDPVLQQVPVERRGSLMASRTIRDERAVYTFDIVLQGGGETVFFNFGRGRTTFAARSRG
ncbi:MAG: protocatechuate 3,4-dioxygenase subunit alpha [Gemmatimonadaceae bacterium]